MGTPLGWTVDDAGGRIILRVHGPLHPDAAPGLHTALLECLAEQPAALLVDLAAMEPAEPAAMAVFSAVVRQATRWPGTPVLFCAPGPATRDLLGRERPGALPTHDSVTAAMVALDEGRTATSLISDWLLPVSGAVRHARNLATEACAAWDLPHLVGPASLVTSELVSNAVEHAGTMMSVSFARRGRNVHITVRDGSTAEPRLCPPPPGAALKGHGLVLVQHLARHWGFLPTRDGKVVWATLRTTG